jgi:hypothetical protein
MCAVSYADSVKNRIPDSFFLGDAFVDCYWQPNFYPEPDRNVQSERVGVADHHSEPIAEGDPDGKLNTDAERQRE